MASEADDNGTPKMKRKAYEKELQRLQAEALQAPGLGEI